MSSSYQILKVPVSREKQVFYYYRRYKAQTDSEAIADAPPEAKSLYVVHFLQPIEESFLLKTFGHAGKIKKTIIGMFARRSVCHQSLDYARRRGAPFFNLALRCRREWPR